MSKKKNKIKRKMPVAPASGEAPVKDQPKQQPPKKKTKQAPAPFSWNLALLAAGITFLVFIPSLSLHFVNWDDGDNLLKNPNLSAFATEWNWASVKEIFSTHVLGNYNPLPIFTFAIEKYFFAPDPAGHPFIFHFDNLWMHLVCTVLVYILLVKLNLGKTAAFIAALLFGIHPMRVESVAWVTERKDVLYGMFFLAALVTYVKYLQEKDARTKWYIWTLVLSIFSYFAKVQAVTLPLTMVALDFYFKRKWTSPKILIVEKLPWWVLSLVFGLVNVYFLRQNQSISFDNNAIVNYTILDKLAVGAYSYATYLVKWIYPFKMSPLYPYPEQLPALAYICLAVVPLAIIAFVVWAFKRKNNNLLFGWAFFTFNVMFLLQIVGAGQGFLADRFTYIAYIGLFFLMAKGYELAVTGKPDLVKPLRTVLVIYFILFAFLTVKQTRIWQDGGTLWEYTLKYFPGNSTPWNNAANYYREERKDFTKAIEYYNQAIARQPGKAGMFNSLAKTYLDYAFTFSGNTPGYQAKQRRLLDSALLNYDKACLEDSIAGFPEAKTTGEILVNRGANKAALGNMDEALADFNRGLSIDPKNANGYSNRSLLYTSTNRYELALEDFNKYLELEPYKDNMYYERGMTELHLGRNNEALADMNRAISMQNNQPGYYIGRARVYRAMGNAAASSNDVRIAQQMGATVPPELLQ